MKLLILDKLKRLWWVWIFYSLIFLTLFGTLLSSTLSASQIKNWWMFFYLFIFCQAMLESRNGYRRVAQTLPFATRQIGRFYWIISVGIPTVLLAIFGGLGVLMASLDSGMNSGIFLTWTQVTVLGFLVLGTSFWFLTGSPPCAAERRRQTSATQARNFGVTALALGGGYIFYIVKWDFEYKLLILGFVGLIFTVLGWRRAEYFLGGNIVIQRQSVGICKTTSTYQPRSGFGGINYLIATSLIWQTSRMLAFTVIFLVTLMILSGNPAALSGISSDAATLVIWIPFILIMDFARTTAHIKFLRTIPLTTWRLAGTLIELASLPFLILGGIAAVVIGMDQGALIGLSFFKFCLLELAPICVLMVAAVWDRENQLERLFFTAIVVFISAIPAFHQADTGIFNSGAKDIPLYFVLGYPLVAIFLAWRVIIRLLETHSMTYKARAQDLRGWGKSWP